MSGGIDTGYGDHIGDSIVRKPVGEIVRWEACPAFVGCAERDCTGCCYLPACPACDGEGQNEFGDDCPHCQGSGRCAPVEAYELRDGQVVPATDDAADQPASTSSRK